MLIGRSLQLPVPLPLLTLATWEGCLRIQWGEVWEQRGPRLSVRWFWSGQQFSSLKTSLRTNSVCFWPLTLLKGGRQNVKWPPCQITQKRGADSQTFLHIACKRIVFFHLGRCYQVLQWIPQCRGTESWIPGMQQDTQLEQNATNTSGGFFDFARWTLSLLPGRCCTCSLPPRGFIGTFITGSRQRTSGPEMTLLSWSC